MDESVRKCLVGKNPTRKIDGALVLYQIFPLWETQRVGEKELMFSGRNRLLDEYFVTGFLGRFVSNY